MSFTPDTIVSGARDVSGHPLRLPARSLARRTGEAHSAINARVNREVGAPSVAKSTVEQLERANALLERAVANG